jgi:foldase protein PrsA
MLRRTFSALLACAAVAVPAAIVAGCGGIPGNAVAEVDGETIERQDFDHWMNVAAKTSGATVPKPPDYAECVAAARKSLPKPAKGQPKTTDAQLKAQCKTQYEQLRNQVLGLLISFEWIDGEAAEQDVTVTDAEVRKTFEQQKKQAYPKEADYQKFLKNSGQTEEDILLRFRSDALFRKLQEKATKGTDKVSAQQVENYYNKNKATFAQPEQRDLRVVLTKTRAKAEQARQQLENGRSWRAVSKQFSIDEASKSQGGRLPAVAAGQQEGAFDEAIFNAKQGELTGPVKTQFGFYVFEVAKISEASQQSLEEATPQIRSQLVTENQQKAASTFVEDLRKQWREKTDCRAGFRTTECQNGPKPTPTATPAT